MALLQFPKGACEVKIADYWKGPYLEANDKRIY